MKKIIYCLPIISFLSLSLITSVGMIQKRNFEKVNGECNHSGYHYNYLNPMVDCPGHEEFWVCCSCHEVFLVEPETGEFIDSSDDLMTGGLSEEHPAYISPIKSLIVNGRRYYPVIGDHGFSEPVTFYDSSLCEIQCADAYYKMTDLGNAVYYSSSEFVSINAVSCINAVSYYDVYGDDPFGSQVRAVREAFTISNNLINESVQMLTTSSEPLNTDPPKISDNFLSDIWRTYRSFGFGSESGCFWSAVNVSNEFAYCWNSYTSMWERRPCLSNLDICLFMTFH